MRQQFFFGLLVLLVCCSAVYFCWLVLKSFFGMYSDWRSDRELDNLETEFDEIRKQRRELESQRLDNGCDHSYEDMLGTFPLNVCVRCGLAKQKPMGPCDHVWRRIDGLIPGSRCEKCGANHGTSATVA